MIELASTMPGCISHKGFFAEDGERVTIVEFESSEAQRAWRMHPEHRDAQRKARDVYYEEYSVPVCEVVREATFRRGAAVAAQAWPLRRGRYRTGPGSVLEAA